MFEARTHADILKLVRENPLAWVISGAAGNSATTPLPLLPEVDATGRIVALLGHISRRNPHLKAMADTPAATILFTGPHGYVSPNIVSKPAWGPTWNYAVAHFETEIELLPAETDAALIKLVDTMEAGQPAPWTADKLGDRFAGLARRVIAFRAHVRTVDARFKLGQDEDEATMDDMLAHFAGTALARWMADFDGRDTGQNTEKTLETVE